MNFAKKALLSGLMASTLVAGAATAMAQHAARQDFDVVNNIGGPIVSLYISPNDDNNWGSDVLGRDVLPVGQTAHIHFSGVNAAVCAWDIKLTDQGGHDYIVQNVDLCATNAIVFARRGAEVTWTGR